MKASFVLTALAGIAGSVSAAAIAAPSNQYPPGVQVTVVDPAYIPAEFKTGAVVTRRDDGQQLQKRADHGVYFCTDANFSGYCVHIVAPANVNVNLGTDLDNLVSSIGPDQNAYCRFFFAHDCQDTDGHFDGLSPGWSNLIVNNANDGVSSYWCSDW